MKNGTNVVREGQVNEFNLGKIPVMIGSKLCHTYGLPKEVLRDLGEDPTDSGGYFIINGGEWAIDSVESILYNKVRIFRNEGHQKKLCGLIIFHVLVNSILTLMNFLFVY